MDSRQHVLINVTVPVYNEEKVLATSVTRIAAMLDTHGYRYEIVIANNASTDGTLAVANSLAAQSRAIRVLHLDEKGRGRAVKAAWRQSSADVLTYMDVDLSTDLAAFPLLIEPLLAGCFDLAAGSRLLDRSLTRRGLKREFISRGYNLLVKAMFRTRFSDAQCGFKAITRKAAAELLPSVENDNWFMDTELLILAEKLGYRIFDLPVRWVDDPDSRVQIFKTAVEDLRGLLRVYKRLHRGPLSRPQNRAVRDPAPSAAFDS
jgi:glycosyltransferase involved in cell wall biosynthesis